MKGACDAAKSAGEEVKGKGGRRKPMPERCLFPRTKVPVPCRTTTLLELRRVGSPKREEYVISKKLRQSERESFRLQAGEESELNLFLVIDVFPDGLFGDMADGLAVIGMRP